MQKTGDVRVPLGAIPSAKGGFGLQTSSPGTMVCRYVGVRQPFSCSADARCLLSSCIPGEWGLGVMERNAGFRVGR